MVVTMRASLLFLLSLSACADGSPPDEAIHVTPSPGGKGDGSYAYGFQLDELDHPTQELTVDCDEWFTCDLQLDLSYDAVGFLAASGYVADVKVDEFPFPSDSLETVRHNFKLFDDGHGLVPIHVQAVDRRSTLHITIYRDSWYDNVTSLGMTAQVQWW
jgi:hypothetical protein